MSQILSVFLFLLSFGLARGGLFFAPIILANLLAPSDYGTLEFAQALASFSATVLALGTSGAVPLILVQKIKRASWGGVLVHQLSVVGVLLVIALGGWLLGISPIFWIAAAFTGVLMLQSLWSVTLKSNGRGEASLLLDTGFWSILTFSAAIAFALNVTSDNRASWSFQVILFYLVGLFFWTFWRFLKVPSNTELQYSETIKISVPLMFGTLLSFLAVTSGRLGIGLLTTPEVTAEYAILFRGMAIPMVAHQIITVYSFRRIFELPPSKLERRLLSISSLVIASVVTIWLLSGLASYLLGSAFSSTFLKYRSEGLLILTQCVMWSAIANNELLCNRWQVAGRAARPSILYFLLVLPLAWLFLSTRPVTLALFVPVHSIVMIGYFLIQIVMLARCSIKMWRMWGLSLGSFLLLSILTQVI